MVPGFQLKYKLSLEPISVTIDYEWKPKACETCKVFGYLCKASVEALNVEDMLKIKNRGDALQACSVFANEIAPLQKLL